MVASQRIAPVAMVTLPLHSPRLYYALDVFNQRNCSSVRIGHCESPFLFLPLFVSICLSVLALFLLSISVISMLYALCMGVWVVWVPMFLSSFDSDPSAFKYSAVDSAVATSPTRSQFKKWLISIRSSSSFTHGAINDLLKRREQPTPSTIVPDPRR